MNLGDGCAMYVLELPVLMAPCSVPAQMQSMQTLWIQVALSISLLQLGVKWYFV